MPGVWWAIVFAAFGAILANSSRRNQSRVYWWVGALLLAAATLRMLVWESYPNLFGNAMAPLWVRAVAFVAAILGWVSSAKAAQTAVLSRRYWAAVLMANLLTVWWIVFEITLRFSNDHQRPSGHEALAVAAVLSLYGLVLALVEHRFPHLYLRQAARVLVSAGLIYLVLGALFGNARWAFPLYRFATYVVVLGAAWAVEAMFGRRGNERDLHGLISLTAMGCGFVIASFEVTRWLEPVFTFPQQMLRTQASWDWEAAVRADWQMITWGLYSLAAMAGAVVARSPRGRLLAGALGLVALAEGVYGAMQTGAPLTLRLPALAAAAGGAALSAWMAGRVDGARLRQEQLLRRALWIGSGGLVLVWAALNVL